MTNVAIVVFCGIPGSGKTTMALNLYNTLSSGKSQSKTELDKWFNEVPLHTHHVCFDTILSPSLEAEIVARLDCQEHTLWKHYRRNIRQCVESCVEVVVGKVRKLPTSDTEGIPNMNKSFSDKLKMFADGVVEKSTRGGRHLFLIDDNMYLPSMRHEYFRVARHCEIAFAQVYLDCPLEVALERNRKRLEAVPDDVVKNIATKLGEPNLQNSWEKYTATVRVPTEMECEISSALEVIKAALQNPFKNDEESLERAQESRIQCSENVRHQIDLILRKLVSAEMRRKTGDNLSHKDLAAVAADLNRRRATILENLRLGTLLVPATSDDRQGGASKETTSELYRFVEGTFHSGPS